METMPRQSVRLGVVPALDGSGQDAEEAYFSRGFVEDLITDLSRFSGWGVIDPHSSFSPDLEELDTEAAAQRLGADYLLRIRVRKQGSRIRLNTQLLHGNDGRVLWAERYDVPGEEVFEVHDRIVAHLSASLSRHIDLATLQASRHKPVPDLAAYDCWLRGCEEMKGGSVEADEAAREYFRQALEIDSHYARAYVGLSLSHFNDWSCQAWDLAEASECLAFQYAREAAKLDDDDHVAHYVLGRVYLYRHEWARASQHLNRALQINANDADALVQIGFCKSLLGEPAVGAELYERATQLNPCHPSWYFAYGAFNHLCLRQYKSSLELALRCPLDEIWADLGAHISATYGHLGEADKAADYAQHYLQIFRSRVVKRPDATPDAALDWLFLVNPYRHETDRLHLLEGLRQGGLDFSEPEAAGEPPPSFHEDPQAPADDRSQQVCRFARQDGLRVICFDGHTASLPELKGFADLERLMAAPEEEIHCSDLMGAVATRDAGTELMDEQARAACRDRICELQADLEEAETYQDTGRVERIREELDPLLDHLARASGLGGRSRKLKDPAEKARSAVTWRIRSAIRKLEEVHPALGRHLDNAIRTGVFCAYTPEKPVEWQLS